ncbi:MarR family transcriptional regulator [Lacrimispora sp. NSJ-141]|uniref:MarR family transcriptional regulator n=1 Tax=Lientehia hominis TaxID=2897778 RepID=A0AAP2RH77_9FIRM|nr:MarR family transcriptional regulator [Lientehia hominis]MCD2491208.1 MarR family transcriptional regulator [Lientehia hominis]
MENNREREASERRAGPHREIHGDCRTHRGRNRRYYRRRTGEESVAQMGRMFFEQIERFHRFSCLQEMSLKLKPSEMMMMIHVDRMAEISAHEEGAKPSDLTGGGFISKPAVSRMLGNLEEKGYLERTASKHDRRVVFVKLTELGRRCLEEERRYRDQMAEQIFERMGQEKMMMLLNLSEELFDYAEEEVERRKASFTE